MEVVGWDRVELEPDVHVVAAGMVGEQVRVLNEGSPVPAWMSIGGNPVRSAVSGLTTASSLGWPAR